MAGVPVNGLHTLYLQTGRARGAKLYYPAFRKPFIRFTAQSMGIFTQNTPKQPKQGDHNAAPPLTNKYKSLAAHPCNQMTAD